MIEWEFVALWYFFMVFAIDDIEIEVQHPLVTVAPKQELSYEEPAVLQAVFENNRNSIENKLPFSGKCDKLYAVYMCVGVFFDAFA